MPAIQPNAPAGAARMPPFRSQVRTASPSVSRSARREADEGVGMEQLLEDIVAPGGPRASRSLDDWMARRTRGDAYEDVHGFVTGHRHRVLHTLTVADVEAATVWPVLRGRTDPRHALGDLDRRTDRMDAVEDWPTPPWAFNYLFHDLMERIGRVPTWPDVEAFVRTDARHRLLEPFAADFGLSGMDRDDRIRHCRALRWRLACSYYSFAREVDLIVRLRRDHGLPVRYHLLADAQFKVDLWCGRVLASLLIANPRYRRATEGRKRRLDSMLDPAAFEPVTIELAVPDAFGKPSLVPRTEIAAMAARLREALGRSGDAGSA